MPQRPSIEVSSQDSERDQQEGLEQLPFQLTEGVHATPRGKCGHKYPKAVMCRMEKHPEMGVRIKDAPPSPVRQA